MNIVGNAINYVTLITGRVDASPRYPAAGLTGKLPKYYHKVRTTQPDPWEAAMLIRLKAQEAGA